MSTASPDTCADVSGVATHRAASSSEPYFETASRSSCSWYAGERQPLLTTKLDPVVRGIGRGLAQGTEQSGVELGHARNLVVEDRHAVGDGAVGLAECTTVLGDGLRPARATAPSRTSDASDWEPRAAAIAAMTTSRPATRQPADPDPAGRRSCWLRWRSCRQSRQRRCCRHVCGFRYAGDMRRLVASEHARADRRGRALHGRGHPRRPAPGGDRGRHRR